MDLLNFGALFAFVGVNVACLMPYFFRLQERRWVSLLVPAYGLRAIGSLSSPQAGLWEVERHLAGKRRTRTFAPVDASRIAALGT